MFALVSLKKFRRGATPMRGSATTAALLAGMMFCADAVCVDSARATLPLPPRRPPEFTPPAAPAPTESLPSPVPPGQRAPIDVETEDLKPYNLPPASRQRMRLCGERWRDLKMTGESRGLTWRSFAEKCLPGKD